jgi:hypothetical protein
VTYILQRVQYVRVWYSDLYVYHTNILYTLSHINHCTLFCIWMSVSHSTILYNLLHIDHCITLYHNVHVVTYGCLYYTQYVSVIQWSICSKVYSMLECDTVIYMQQSEYIRVWYNIDHCITLPYCTLFYIWMSVSHSTIVYNLLHIDYCITLLHTVHFVTYRRVWYSDLYVTNCTVW